MELNNLQELLFKVSLAPIEEQLKQFMRVIREATNAQIVSLWSVNGNLTKKRNRSTSLLKRDLPKEHLSMFNSDDDFAHEITDSFVAEVLRRTEATNNSFYACTSHECQHHRSHDKLQALGVKYYIGIPIELHSTKSVFAVICLYFNYIYPHCDIDKISKILRDYSSVFFERLISMKKQTMTEKMLNLKQQIDIGDSASTFFSLIVNELLRKQCDYEGASIFAWDSYHNRFNLLATTGITNINNTKDVFYYSGEGLTGRSACGNSIIIYDSLSQEKNNIDHIEKWKEDTVHQGATMMIVPIIRVASDDEVIGIIRIINKVNSENNTVLDYFNDFDIIVLKYISEQIALILESYLGKELQNDFITRLTHEIQTPARSIYKSAIQLAKHFDDNDMQFVWQNLRKYLDDIAFYAEYQEWQSNATLFLSKAKQRLPLKKQYDIERTNLRKILNKSKSIANPIARENKVSIAGIVINQNIPLCDLYIDEKAFISVFYNLMTNSIKYHQPQIAFYMGISSSETEDGINIVFEDYGIGINPNEGDKIFQIGYRSDNACRMNANGFGIGLSISKKIITDFGGTIAVTSFCNPTRIRITLPNMLKNNNYLNSEKWIK